MRDEYALRFGVVGHNQVATRYDFEGSTMGLRLFFSDSVDALAARLCAEIESMRGVGLLPPPIRVVVPNANLAKWLKLTIAETNQVAINLEFPYLEKGLWEMVKAVGGARWAAVRPLDAPLLQRAISARIARECATNPDSILAKYCLRATTTGAGDSGAAFPQDNDAVRT